jgi:hypothetical protein
MRESERERRERGEREERERRERERYLLIQTSSFSYTNT